MSNRFPLPDVTRKPALNSARVRRRSRRGRNHGCRRWAGKVGAMTDRGVTESVVEQAALAWVESVGWQVRSGAEIAPGEPAAEREDYGQVVLEQRLHDALTRLNPALPVEAVDDALLKLTR